MHALPYNKNLDKITFICDYIKRNYNKILFVADIANYYGYSSEYLSRYFKKHTGMTIHNYINNIRLMNAHRDLLNTDNSITFIALENGFPNEKSFTKAFKAVYRKTPDKYRKENYENDNQGIQFMTQLDEAYLKYPRV